MQESGPKPSARTPFIIFVVVVLAAIYALNVFNTGNILWFAPIQPSYRPTRIVVRHYGTTTNFRPGDEGYEVLAEALDDTFADFRNTATISLGLSDDTLHAYDTVAFVVEAYYGEDVRFNTPVRMTGVNQLLFPVDARHSGKGYLFMGSNGSWRVGAMQVSDAQPLLSALDGLGYGVNN